MTGVVLQSWEIIETGRMVLVVTARLVLHLVWGIGQKQKSQNTGKQEQRQKPPIPECQNKRSSRNRVDKNRDLLANRLSMKVEFNYLFTVFPVMPVAENRARAIDMRVLVESDYSAFRLVPFGQTVAPTNFPYHETNS